MKTIKFREWIFEYDDEKTKIAYSRFNDRCTCNGCTNLFAIFDKLNPYPIEIQSFFTKVGIDYRVLVNAVPHYFDAKRNQFFYSGWYHFVGKILEGGEGKTITKIGVDSSMTTYHYIGIDKDFSVAFHKDNAIAQTLFRKNDLDNLVQIEFNLWINWIEGELDELDIY